MNNILTIYKMNLPFGEGSFYDTVKYENIIREIHWFFQYKDIFISKNTEKYKEFEATEILFEGGKIKFIFYYEKKYFFLPSFQVDIFCENKLDESVLKELYKFFSNMDKYPYIFDVISEKIIFEDSNIVTDTMLSQSFKKFNFDTLEAFLKNGNTVFIEEQLEQNPIMKNNLLYLVFLNYKLFKNILLTEGGIQELEDYLGKDIDDAFMKHLTLSQERITHISDINIEVFKKYKNMLEGFFTIFLNK